ncbi:MAG TPA: PHP domain-containing protein, partial [Gemmatimonadales bacterium]|nr:PHP domain-containing protein [Gemmatimonadales bacterium]
MYAELHCHSAFSFLDGASPPDEILAEAHRLGYPALALTDRNGIYGSLAFAHAAKPLGLQAITGAEVALTDGSHLILLAETPQGYTNLCRLLTEAHLGAERLDPRLPLAAIESRNAGLIVLSGSRRDGLLSRTLETEGLGAARKLAERCKEVFGQDRFFVEIQRNRVRGDSAVTRALAALANDVGLGVVATGNVHYHTRELHRLHDIMVAIRHRTTLDGSHRVRNPNSEFYLRPLEEVVALFH